MKMKRIICLLLSVVMVVVLLSGCGNNQPETTNPTQDTSSSQTQLTETQPTEPLAEDLINPLDVPALWKEELRYADSLGFPMTSLEQPTITGGELAELLDIFMEHAAPDKLEQWEDMYPLLRKNSEPISRINLLGAVYLAMQFASGAYDINYLIGVDTVDQRIGEKAASEWDYISQELFGGAETVGFFDLGDFGEDHLGVACSYYNIANACPVDGEYPVAFDLSTDSFRFPENATYLDALMAIIRPMVSVNVDLFDSVPDEQTATLLADADARREMIFNTESEWTLGEGGTIYYVSPNGDDNNDGLTPETAWRSLDKVNSATIRNHSYMGSDQDIVKNLNTVEFPAYAWAVENPDNWAELKPGDVVLFERGSIWRGQLIGAKGVTYSAYGEGAKPEIWGSPENGSGAEKWSLLEGTDNIWVFYRELQECGGILLNGETVAIKETPLWDSDTQQWRDADLLTELCTARLEDLYDFDVTAMEDLHFFNELQGMDQSMPYACWGKLYLRCDTGNPGEIYDSIEFFTSNDGWGHGVVSAEGGVLDNLCFRYLSSGVGMEPDSTVQNCVVMWVGGIVLGYAKYDDSYCVVTRCGDGIGAGTGNTKAVNNYIAYCYDFGITVESYLDVWFNDLVLCRNASVSDNLIENCAGGILVAAWDAYDAGFEAPLFQNVTLDGNYILHTGHGWSHKEEALLMGGTYLSSLVINLNPGNSDISVTNNVLYDCWNLSSLVNYGYYNGDDTAVDFEGNTFVLNPEVRALLFHNITDGSYALSYYADETLRDNITNVLGDSTAKIYLFDRVFNGQE